MLCRGAEHQGGDLGCVYLQVSASVQLQSMQLGTPKYLTPGETEKCTDMFLQRSRG